MAVNLQKGQKISLEKEAGGALSRVTMGLGWDVAKSGGFFGFGAKSQAVDLDASVVLFDESNRPVDVVWFRQLKSRDGSITHTGDNRTGAGDGDDEQIIVDLRVRTQSLGNALFAQSGGFFVTETSGSGQVVVSGFGSMSVLEVEPGKDAIIDNSHVVAWDSTLHYEISITTGTSGGFLGNLINSQTSGEGLVLRFSGRGKIYVCSRNRATFKAWMQAPGR